MLVRSPKVQGGEGELFAATTPKMKMRAVWSARSGASTVSSPLTLDEVVLGRTREGAPKQGISSLARAPPSLQDSVTRTEEGGGPNNACCPSWRDRSEP